MLNNIPKSNFDNSQQSYSYSTAPVMIPRGWLIFSQIFGVIFSVIGMFVFIAYMQKIYTSLPGNDFTNKSLTALFLSIIVYFTWRSIYTAFIIVRLARTATDEELSANRYIISALSLSVGGFFTPFLITQFSNISTTSTIKPRYFLSKTLGLCLLIGAPILAITYFLPLLVGPSAVTNISMIFNESSAIGIISILVLSLSVISFILGLVTTVLFSKNHVLNAFDNNPSKLLKVISTVWMTILTLELIVVILFALLRLLAAFVDLFRAQEEGAGGFLMVLFAFFNLLLTISYVGMIVYIISRTIAGLWSIDGTVKIGKYNHGKWTKSNLFEPKVNVTKN